MTIGPKLGSSGTLHIGKGFITAQNWCKVNAGLKSRQLKDAVRTEKFRLTSNIGFKRLAAKEPGKMLDQIKLLSGFLCLLFLLPLQPVHVRLQQVAVGQLEFVHLNIKVVKHSDKHSQIEIVNLLGVDHCGDLLIFEDSPET